MRAIEGILFEPVGCSPNSLPVHSWKLRFTCLAVKEKQAYRAAALTGICSI